MATIKFWQEMQRVVTIDGQDKLMIGKNSTGEAQYVNVEDLNQFLSIVGTAVKPIPGGATEATAVVLQPNALGQTREMNNVTGWFKNPTGPAWEAPLNSINSNWWDGSIWSLGSSTSLPIQEGVDVINPVGGELPTEKAVADYVNNEISDLNESLIEEISETKEEIYNSIVNNSIDLETKPTLTPNRYISSNGGVVTTAESRWNATVNFEPLKGATVLNYKGNFGSSATRLAFYSEDNLASFISSVPSADSTITDQDFDIPSNAKYYRASCFDPSNNIFLITLKNIPLISDVDIPLSTFEYVGNSFVYLNDNIKESNIIWNDGSTGRVIYNDWDDVEATFKSFIATSVENNIQATQPAVTFNTLGQITNYPSLIFTNI